MQCIYRQDHTRKYTKYVISLIIYIELAHNERAWEIEDHEIYNDSLVYDHHKANQKNEETTGNCNTLENRENNEEFGLKSANKDEGYIEEEAKEVENFTQREAKANTKSDNKLTNIEINRYNKAESYCKGEANSCEDNAILLTNQEEANEILNMRETDRNNPKSSNSIQGVKGQGNDTAARIYSDQMSITQSYLNGNASEKAQHAKSTYSKVKKDERLKNTEATSKETILVGRNSILSNHSNVLDVKDDISKRSARSLNTVEKAVIRGQSKDFTNAVLDYATSKYKEVDYHISQKHSHEKKVEQKPSKVSVISTTSSHIKAKSREFTNQVLEFNSAKRSEFN